MYINVYVFVFVYVYVFVCVCVCMYIYIYICTKSLTNWQIQSIRSTVYQHNTDTITSTVPQTSRQGTNIHRTCNNKALMFLRWRNWLSTDIGHILPTAQSWHICCVCLSVRLCVFVCVCVCSVIWLSAALRITVPLQGTGALPKTTPKTR